MRPVNAADDGASSRSLAENTEAMRRWSLGGAYRRVARGPAKGFLKNGAAALMREANEIGSGSGACARQGRGVRRRSASFRSCSSLGFGLLEENRRAVQRFARLCSYSFPLQESGLSARPGARHIMDATTKVLS